MAAITVWRSLAALVAAVAATRVPSSIVHTYVVLAVLLQSYRPGLAVCLYALRTVWTVNDVLSRSRSISFHWVSNLKAWIDSIKGYGSTQDINTLYVQRYYCYELPLDGHAALCSHIYTYYRLHIPTYILHMKLSNWRCHIPRLSSNPKLSDNSCKSSTSSSFWLCNL